MMCDGGTGWVTRRAQSRYTLGERFLRVVKWEGGPACSTYSRLLATAMIPCKACISKSVVGRVSVGKTVEYNQPSKSIPKPFLSFPFVYSFTLVGSLLMRLGEFPREWNRDWSSFDECCWSGLGGIRWRIWKWMMDGQIEILDKIFRYFNRSNK